MSEQIEQIKKLAMARQPELVEARRDFHSNPELAWKEARTTAKIAEYLKPLGFEILKQGIHGTESGLIAELSGSEGGKTFALRADIDALSVHEETGTDYASRVDGVSHACGHDAHAAMLMGAAGVLSGLRDSLRGRVRLLFQPAEEGGHPSGAEGMIEDGALDGVDAIFGMHIQATLPSGIFSWGFGPRMTASGKWRVLIKGHGSHGAFPEWSKDPVVAASNFVMNLQTLVSREKRPLDAAVVSVGMFKPSSETFNVIPDRVELQGTTRAYTEEVQGLLRDGISRIAEHCAAVHRCGTECSFEAGLPPLVNDREIVSLARDTASLVLGPGAMLEEDPQMGSEDFSYYLQEKPGSYCFLGCGGVGKASPYAHHSPKFDIDESVLWMGSAIHAATALKYLENAD